MKQRVIPIAGPSISQHEIDSAAEAVRTAWYEQAGGCTARFEEEFADYLGVRYAVAVPHCTAAIHLALAGLGVGPGDEVVIPELTWIASSAPISYVGATPVFADVDPESWCIDVAAVERRLSARTRAIIAVDLYGGMPDYERLTELAHRRGIPMIEDAAEAIGSELLGRKAGAWGDVGVFSFHGSKTLTTGEGGMLVTDSASLYERGLFLRDHGRQPGDVSFQNEEVAYKYRMSDLQAAVGTAQLARVADLVAKKRQIHAWYRQELADLPEMTWNPAGDGLHNSYWMTTALFPTTCPFDKLAAVRWMAARGISTRPFFHPLSSLPAYRSSQQAQTARRSNQAAYALSPRGLNLPSALSLTRDDVAYVARTLRELWRDLSLDRVA